VARALQEWLPRRPPKLTPAQQLKLRLLRSIQMSL
jgi:hypothetical protein